MKADLLICAAAAIVFGASAAHAQSDMATGKREALPAGSYAYVPAKVPHYGSCKGDTVVQAHGTGPFKIYFAGAEGRPDPAGY